MLPHSEQFFNISVLLLTIRQSRFAESSFCQIEVLPDRSFVKSWFHAWPFGTAKWPKRPATPVSVLPNPGFYAWPFGKAKWAKQNSAPVSVRLEKTGFFR